MVKTCSSCKKGKGEDQFDSINYRRKNAVVKTCLDCRKRFNKKDKKRMKPYMERWNKWKKQPCTGCGLMFPMVIEADHCTNRGKKVVNVSDVSNYWSRKPMVLYEMELDKCIPLCIMCQRKKNQEVCNGRK